MKLVENYVVFTSLFFCLEILLLELRVFLLFQHVLERGKQPERSEIISKLTGRIVQMSQHKYASNVVEKCLEYADAGERESLIEEILAQPEENDNLLVSVSKFFK